MGCEILEEGVYVTAKTGDSTAGWEEREHIIRPIRARIEVPDEREKLD